MSRVIAIRIVLAAGAVGKQIVLYTNFCGTVSAVTVNGTTRFADDTNIRAPGNFSEISATNTTTAIFKRQIFAHLTICNITTSIVDAAPIVEANIIHQDVTVLNVALANVVNGCGRRIINLANKARCGYLGRQ
jgi:hypothetical protein